MSLVVRQNPNASALVEARPSVSSALTLGGAAAAAANAEKASNTEQKRTSRLAEAEFQLLGHKGAVNTCAFSPNGSRLATGCADGGVYIWTVYSNPPRNLELIPMHKNQVLQLAWTPDSTKICTASADCSGAVFDMTDGVRLKKLRHGSYVNSVATAAQSAATPSLFLTGSDDCSAKLWDLRQSLPAAVFKHKYPVTSVALSPDANTVFTASIDEVIRAFDVRGSATAQARIRSATGQVDPSYDDENIEGVDVTALTTPVFSLEGHKGAITGISVNADSSVLASTSTDASVMVWDTRRFVTEERLSTQGRIVSKLTGFAHDEARSLPLKCAFSGDGAYIASGSSDNNLYIWSSLTGELKYRLPGHNGAVLGVAFHPTEPIVASASADRTVFLSEIEKAM